MHTAQQSIRQVHHELLGLVRHLYCFLLRPRTKGVKVVLTHEGRILLIRIGYTHRRWTLPGGSVDGQETFETAAIREVFEEVGIKLTYIRGIGAYDTNHQYKQDHVKCFIADIESPDYVIDGFEIDKAMWFRLDQLPSDRAPRVDMILQMAGLNHS